MCYFSNAIKFPSITRDEICRALNNSKFNEVDFIVGTGISGAMMLVPVSIELNTRCGVVRKKIDVSTKYRNGGSHSSMDIESCAKISEVNQYVIIDDTIESGDTVNRIIRLMSKEYERSKCVGIILYQLYPGMGKHKVIDVICLGERIHDLAKKD